MTWRAILLRSAYRQARRYLGYIASSAAAVAIFFMFIAFVLNPAVGRVRGLGNLFAVTLVAVAAFALFFVVYFHSMLMRSRGGSVAWVV